MARDNTIGLSTAYAYRDERIAVLAARSPSLHGALLAAKAAGYSHVIVDGTLIYTDRIATPGPTPGVDLWWSGIALPSRGQHPGRLRPGRMAVVTSQVRPGREHDTTAARADPTCSPGSPTGSATAS